MKREICLLCLILFLTSCSSAVQILPSTVPTTSALTSPSVLASTETSTAIPTTQMATLSATSTPSRTSTIVPTQLSSLLTAQVSWNVCDGAKEPSYDTDLSPDGNWLAVKCENASDFTGTKITSLDKALSWSVSFYDTYGKYQDMKDGEMDVFSWSKDGIYVYLVPYFCCVDAPEDIFFNYFQNTLALYRLNLLTGKITTTLQPFKDDVFLGYKASISPSSKYIGYVISNSVRDLHIYNLQTGETFTITVDEQYIASGRFSWSPDSSKAIFIAVKYGWSDYETSISNGVSYFLLDLKTKTSNHIFDQPDMYQISWTQDGNIILHDVSGQDGLLYNLQNNTFTAVTPTPSP